MRPLIVAAAGLFLLGVGGLTASHFVHSEQPWSQVSCLNSTCTAGMAMDSRMDGHASPGNGPAMQDRAASPPVVAPSGPRSRRSPLARFLRALRQDLPRR